jgi:ribosomal protein L22
MTKPGDPNKIPPAQAAEEEQVELEAAEAKAEAAEVVEEERGEEAPDAEAKPRRRRTRAKKAEATAAEETGVDKDAAEAALAEGSSEPVDEPAKAKAKAEKPKPAPAPRRAGDRRPVVRAQAKYVRTSARKARLVCDHIRGKSVTEARAILAHAPRAVARDWAKLLESAVANAEHNHELVGEDLRILSVTADEGPTLKRFRPRAMGRATRIRKRTSHLTITLTPEE